MIDISGAEEGKYETFGNKEDELAEKNTAAAFHLPAAGSLGESAQYDSKDVKG
jgi:hypothetical protein